MSPADHLSAFLAATGFSDSDPELVGTPERVAALLADFVPRPVRPPSLCATTVRTPVVVSRIPFHSLCAHHLLPFFGTVSIGYLPRDRMVGFGSLPRLVADLSRRPQLQERLGQALVDMLVEWVDPEAAVVVIRARHLCVEMRGAPSTGEVFTLASAGTPDGTLVSEVRA